MAILRAFGAFDLAAVDLNFFSRNLVDTQFGDGVNTTFAGVSYPDLYVINSKGTPNDQSLLLLGGDLTVSGKAISGGTVNALAEGEKSGAVKWYAQSIGLAATDVYAAVQSSTKDDDIALLAAALAGNDQITLSAFDDKVSAFGGDDVVTGGAGNDDLDGGDGIDTAVYLGSRDSATIAVLEGSVLQIEVPGEGIDTLRNFEIVRFGDQDYTIAQLADVVPPTAIGFSPGNGVTFGEPGANIEITYDDEIQVSDGVIELRRGTADGEIVETFIAGVSSLVTASGEKLVINPTADLAPGETYVLTMTAGTVRDSIGNSAASIDGYEFQVLPLSDQWRMFANDGFSGAIGGSGIVYGTNGMQSITVLDVAGTVTLDGSFNRGGDVLRIHGKASEWEVSLSGSSAIFSDGDTFVVAPIGIVGLPVAFSDGARLLRYVLETAQVKIGDQAVTVDETVIDTPADGTRLPFGADSNASASILLSAGADVVAGGKLEIFGTVENESVELKYGNAILDASFARGGDSLTLDLPAASFTGKLSGAQLLLDSIALDVQVPVGTEGMPVSFDGMLGGLRYDIDIGSVMLGNQAISTNAAPIVLG